MSDPNSIVILLVIGLVIGFMGFVVGVVLGALFLGHLFHPDDRARDALSDLEAQYANLLDMYNSLCEARVEEQNRGFPKK